MATASIIGRISCGLCNPTRRCSARSVNSARFPGSVVVFQGLVRECLRDEKMRGVFLVASFTDFRKGMRSGGLRIVMSVDEQQCCKYLWLGVAFVPVE